MYLQEFLIIATAHLIAVMSPGPDFVMICKQSLLYSKKIGIYTALGLALGILVHVTYSLIGLGLIISQSILLYNSIKFLGAAYLIYIGVKSILSKHVKVEISTQKNSAKEGISVFSAVRTGFLTNALNPKATLFFLALFTQVISVQTPQLVQIGYGLWMVLATFLWFSFVATILNIELIRSKFLKVSKWIEKGTGAVLILLGLKIATEKN